MADPRSASTRRVFLSYSHLKELTNFPALMLEDYQAIQQDFTYTTDEIDLIDIRVTTNEVNITDLQDSHYPNLSSQVQFLQQQIDGLPEFTMDTEGFTMDSTEWTMDKVLA
ncbi:MAG: hypothetical protein ACI9N9_000301 [Enterobacterales bacterium]|jgi:hypothetical protein